MAIAAVVPIQKNRLGYQVPSQSGNGSYVVSIDDEPFCTCPDFEQRQERCKHVYAVEFTVQREDQSDASPETVRVALGPSWTAYNLAQTNEQELFGTLLHELCATVSQPPQGKGRPRLPISDMLFAVGLKVYSTMSGRRAMTDFRNAQADGLLSTCPSFSTAFRYVETAFSMIKAKFGGAVRSKTPVAQMNEVLVKILCHNICVLIQAMYALGVAPEFGAEKTFGSKPLVDAKVS